MRWIALLLALFTTASAQAQVVVPPEECIFVVRNSDDIETYRCPMRVAPDLACRAAGWMPESGVEPSLARLSATLRDNLNDIAGQLPTASCNALASLRNLWPVRSDGISEHILHVLPSCPTSDAARAAAAAEIRRIAQQPNRTLDERCYVLEERVATGHTPIELDPNDAVTSDYYDPDEPQWVVLTELDWRTSGTLRVSGLSSPPVGAVALQVAGAALGVGVGAPEADEPELLEQHPTSGYRRRVLRMNLGRGDRVRIEGSSYSAEVDSMTTFGIVIGASLTGEFVVQSASTGPTGGLSETSRDPTIGPVADPTTDEPIRIKVYNWSATSCDLALSAYAFIGFRYRDFLIAPGILLASTIGDPLQGASLRIGRRARSLSRSVYWSVVVGVRWGEVPEDPAMYQTSTSADLIPTTMQAAATIGLELSFDIATVVGSPGGFVNTLLGGS